MTRHPSMPSFARVASEAPNPDEATVKILATFVDHGWPLTRREAEIRAFGHTSFTANWAVDAFKALRAKGYIERLPLSDTKFRVTERGVAALGVFRACETPDGAA